MRLLPTVIGLLLLASAAHAQRADMFVNQQPVSSANPVPTTSTPASGSPGTSPGTPSYVAPPSGTFNDPSSSLSPAYTLATANTDYTVVPALTGTQSRKALTIFNETLAATVTCNDLGNSATTGGSIAFTTFLNYTQIGFLPNGAVHCQSNTASTLIAVREAH